MFYRLGQRSLANLDGVHPDLVRIVKRAIELTEQDFTVLEGVRSDEQAYANFGKGRTVAQMRAAGVPAAMASEHSRPQLKKVTWLKNPLNTRHRRQADGYGHAVDCVPYPISWANEPKNLARFDAVARAMFAAAAELGVKIRWGADWDEDGIPRERGEADSPHFELDRRSPAAG